MSQRTAAPTMNNVAGKNDYAQLKALIFEAGLMEQQSGYYAVKLAYTVGLFALGVVAMFLLDGWWKLLVAPYLGFVSAQLGFLSHDLGHKQVFRSNRVNSWMGMIMANVLTGMSLGWWNDKHNAHHANPNHDGLDPDIDIPFMVFSEEQAARKTGMARVVAAYQAFLFFPALTFTVYSMEVASALFTARAQYKWRLPDTLLFWGHMVLYYVGLPVLLGPWLGLAFIVVHRAVLGVMIGAVFAPNHKGMLVVGENDEKLDFLRKQVLTSRSVRSTPFIDFMYGGLNHQAVHHLFPSMPRNKLASAEAMTRRFCEERQVSYHVTGVRQSFVEILTCLHDTSASLRHSAPALPSDKDGGLSLPSGEDSGLPQLG